MRHRLMSSSADEVGMKQLLSGSYIKLMLADPIPATFPNIEVLQSPFKRPNWQLANSNLGRRSNQLM